MVFDFISVKSHKTQTKGAEYGDAGAWKRVSLDVGAQCESEALPTRKSLNTAGYTYVSVGASVMHKSR